MKVGDLVRLNTHGISILKPSMPVGIIIEGDLVGTDDFGFEYEYKAVFRTCWPNGIISEHFEDELEVIFS